MPTDAPVASILGTQAFGTDWVSRSTTAVSTHRPGASGQVAPSAQVHGTTAQCATYGWNAGYEAGYPEEEYRHAAVVPGSSIDLEDHRQDPVRYTALCRCPTALHAGLAIATPRSPGHPLLPRSRADGGSGTPHYRVRLVFRKVSMAAARFWLSIPEIIASSSARCIGLSSQYVEETLRTALSTSPG